VGSAGLKAGLALRCADRRLGPLLGSLFGFIGFLFLCLSRTCGVFLARVFKLMRLKATDL
jgi:hypothetical protein